MEDLLFILVGGFFFFLMVFFILKETKGNTIIQGGYVKNKKECQENIYFDTDSSNKREYREDNFVNSYSRNERIVIKETIVQKDTETQDKLSNEELKKKHQEEYERWRYYYKNQASNLHGFNVEIDDTKYSKTSFKNKQGNQND